MINYHLLRAPLGRDHFVMDNSGSVMVDASDAKTLRLSFSGVIDESFEFPRVDVVGRSFGEIEIDLNVVRAINSIGIRKWISWMKLISESGIPMRFTRVPASIVLQFNMVEGFLPSMSTVDSVFVPLFCEKCEREWSSLFSTRDLQNGALPASFTTLVQQKDCGAEKCALTPEYSDQKYFAFLKKGGPGTAGR